MVRNLWQKLLLSLLLGTGVLAAFMLYTDVQSLRTALIRFEWGMLLPVLLVTGVNLFARFIKWEYYLRRLEVQGVSRGTSLAIFLANYALILTPGKVGGMLKSYFLKQSSGVPVARTLPIIVAERLTDGLGMLLMTTVALLAYPAAWPVVLLTFLGVVAVIFVIQARPLALRLLALGETLPGLNRFATTLHTLYESAYDLLRLRPLLWATFLGTVARAMEGVALYFVLLGLGVAPGTALLEQSVFIAALSNIVGVIVMMPGGLGGTEGSMAGLLDYFVGLAPGPATAATLLSRFASFWVPALLGLVSLWLKRETFFAPEPEEEALAPEAATP